MDTKSMRQKILDLAIRGKLVPQDPTDEPASVLLERIRAEKQQMVKDGKLKAKDIKDDSIIFKGEDNLHYEKVGSEVKCIETEIPFEVPDSWEWSRLSALGTFAGGKTPSTANCDFWGGDVLWVTSKDMKTKYIDDTLIKMSDVGSKQMQLFPPDSLLMVVRSGILRRTFPLAILKTQATVNQDIKVCSLYLPFMAEYIYNYLKASELGILTHCSKSGTTVESVNVEDIKNLLIAIPPETEQRVVAHTISLAFAQIEAIELDKINLQSIIDRAKSKILDLAIRGKLVPQDPADESASVLLERIRAEKEQLIKAGKIKRDKNESYIFRGDDKSYYEKVGDSVRNIDDEIRFDVPASWGFVRLGTAMPYEQPQPYIVTSTEYDASYPTPVLTAGKSFIIGYTNETDGIKTDLPTVIFDDFTTDSKYVNFPFKVKSSAMKILTADSSFADIKFYYYVMQKIECTHSTHKRYWISDFSQKIVPLPPLQEQKRIVAVIEAMEQRLATIMGNLN